MMLALGGIILWVHNKKLIIRVIGWILIVLAMLFSLFVIELIISFIQEGAPQAALVMGGIFGFVAIIIWVLIGRFILSNKSKRND